MDLEGWPHTLGLLGLPPPRQDVCTPLCQFKYCVSSQSCPSFEDSFEGVPEMPQFGMLGIRRDPWLGAQILPTPTAPLPRRLFDGPAYVVGGHLLCARPWGVTKKETEAWGNMGVTSRGTELIFLLPFLKRTSGDSRLEAFTWGQGLGRCPSQEDRGLAEN